MSETPFNGSRYITLQQQSFTERFRLFEEEGATTFCEVGGRFLSDAHAARVLPGFSEDSKVQVLKPFFTNADVVCCANSDDLLANTPVPGEEGDRFEETLQLLTKTEEAIGQKPSVVLTLVNKEKPETIAPFHALLEEQGYTVYLHYRIPGYPKHTLRILSDEGFSQNEPITLTQPIVFVIGLTANSGKFSTCLSELYQRLMRNEKVGYVKYELFPISTLPIHHPVNIAYEAATADIGDYCMEDTRHLKAFGKHATTYNRDAELFGLLRTIIDTYAPQHSFLRTYHSPTSMGVNRAGEAIHDDSAIRIAAVAEIKRRLEEAQASKAPITTLKRLHELLIEAQHCKP